jgi:hypothetical protein
MEDDMAPPRLVTGYIYYSNPNTVPDKAFERAARWSAASNVIGDVVCEIVGVTTKQDFINAWKGVLNQATFNQRLVDSVEIYSHASKQNDDLDGLEFANGPGGATLTQSDILALPRLPWYQGGFMYLFACNSGLVGTRGWCPAQAFLNGQGLRQANGEAGFAYFSKDSETYVEVSSTDQQIYLHAYRRMRNGPLGDGGRIEPVMFSRNRFRDLIHRVALDFVEGKRRSGQRYVLSSQQEDAEHTRHRLAIREGDRSVTVDDDGFAQEVLAAMKNVDWPVVDGWGPEAWLLEVQRTIVRVSQTQS